MKFSKLYIEKTVDAHADDVVEKNEELTYSILIKNNSNIDYEDEITVTENISEYVEFIENESNFEVQKNGNELKWNIGKLGAGEEIEIKYTVKVKESYEGETTNGQTIESKGRVENIPSAVVKNKIGNNLKNNNENKIEAYYEDLKEIYNGKELINEI